MQVQYQSSGENVVVVVEDEWFVVDRKKSDIHQIAYVVVSEQLPQELLVASSILCEMISQLQGELKKAYNNGTNCQQHKNVYNACH